MSCLSWLSMFGGPALDFDPGDEIMRELDQPAACDKHRELVEDVANDTAIAQYQQRIVANGGKVVVK